MEPCCWELEQPNPSKPRSFPFLLLYQMTNIPTQNSTIVPPMPIPTPSATNVVRFVAAVEGDTTAGGGAIAAAAEVTPGGRGGGSRSSAGDGMAGGGGEYIGGGAASGGGEDIIGVQLLQLFRRGAPVFPFSGRIVYSRERDGYLKPERAAGLTHAEKGKRHKTAPCGFLGRGTGPRRRMR